MPADEFESLVERATAGSSRQKAPEAPRLIRARHHARWSSGVLTGQTELVIESGPSGPVDYVLDPWSPAVVGATGSAAADSREASFPQIRSPVRRGHSLTLLPLLPALASTTCWVPAIRERRVSGSTGHPRSGGPPGLGAPAAKNGARQELQSGASRRRDHNPVSRGPQGLDTVDSPRAPARSARGSLGRSKTSGKSRPSRVESSFSFTILMTGGESPAGSNLWVSGATQIDLRGTLDRSGGLVNWSTDWMLELDPRNPKPLEVELDPGLELINVVGPAVRGYRILPSAGADRVVVTFGGELKPATEVRFLAHARVPTEGRWPIPAIRPLSATWTGGTTTVILDPFHVVAECIEKAGRRVFGAGGESPGINQLVFQAESPLSVAELVFRKPRTESSCFIRGHLFVSGSPCRLECQLDWTAEQALSPELEIELSPGGSRIACSFVDRRAPELASVAGSRPGARSCTWRFRRRHSRERRSRSS